MRYDGIVKEIYDNCFYAILYGKSNNTEKKSEVFIPLHLVSAEELPHLTQEAVFTWFINSENNTNYFVFSREKWTEEEKTELGKRCLMIEHYGKVVRSNE